VETIGWNVETGLPLPVGSCVSPALGATILPLAWTPAQSRAKVIALGRVKSPASAGLSGSASPKAEAPPLAAGGLAAGRQQRHAEAGADHLHQCIQRCSGKAAVLRAQGLQESAILEAEGRKQAQISIAEADAQLEASIVAHGVLQNLIGLPVARKKGRLV